MEGEVSFSSGFVWPQRNYTCSFCKRQFNSAQALGGHMNVHRRDRAMLIQLPSWVFDQYPNPNSNSNSKSQPNPKISSSVATTQRNYTHQYPFHLSASPVSSAPTSSSYGNGKSGDQFKSCVPLFEDLIMKKKSRNNVVEVEEFKRDYFGQQYGEIEVLEQNHEVISLDLEIGCKDHKEVLDLELRLGCF